MTDPDDIRRRLDDYLATLAHAQTGNPFVDLDTAKTVAGRLNAVVDRWSVLSPDDREAVLSVVDYVLDADDEEHDMRSPIGFADDEERVTDLLNRLGIDPRGSGNPDRSS